MQNILKKNWSLIIASLQKRFRDCEQVQCPAGGQRKSSIHSKYAWRVMKKRFQSLSISAMSSKQANKFNGTALPGRAGRRSYNTVDCNWRSRKSLMLACPCMLNIPRECAAQFQLTGCKQSIKWPAKDIIAETCLISGQNMNIGGGGRNTVKRASHILRHFKKRSFLQMKQVGLHNDTKQAEWTDFYLIRTEMKLAKGKLQANIFAHCMNLQF